VATIFRFGLKISACSTSTYPMSTLPIYETQCWCFRISKTKQARKTNSPASYIASLGAHHRRTAEPALVACSGTYQVQSCRAHVQGLKRPCAAVSVVGFHPCCRRAVSTPTPLSVHRSVAGAVLPAVNDRTEGVPHRWCTCLECSSL